MMRTDRHRRTMRALLLGLAVVATPLSAAPGADPAPSQTDGGVIALSIGDSRIVNLSAPMTDIIVADPNVADVHPRSRTQLFIIAKAPGQSAITVTSGGKTVYRALVRVDKNITSIDQMLRLAMPDADVRVATMNGMVLLTGTVAAPEDSAEAERLVAAFVGDKVNVVSRLKTATPLTVNLQVRIAEVSKTISKQIGMNLATFDPTSGFKFGIGQGRNMLSDKWVVGADGSTAALNVGNGTQSFIDPVSGAAVSTALSSQTTGTTFGANANLFGLNVLAALDLAENQGLATTLANPNLTALSGETASFLAGGEIPIPLSSSLGEVSVDYKQYGVSLAFTPTVLADGRISMRVRPEVSQIDESAGVKLNSFSIPGISTRRAETTVELGSGQSFMIGGLLSTTSGNSVSKAPFLGDLPILGNLFKSTSYRRQETELVIIVTPYLVKPVNASDLRLPTDGLDNATDAQRLLGARLHDGKSGKKRPVPTMAPAVTVPEAGKPAAAREGSEKTARTAAAPGFSF